jgi:PAS domain-containing protein
LRLRINLSLRAKLAAVLLGVVGLAAALGAWVAHALDSVILGWCVSVAVAAGPIFWLAARIIQPITQMLRALSSTVASYREGDFSLSLVADRDDELGELIAAHNELAAALRLQRAHLVQRELLLDTVMQNSPVALVLVDANERIAYANIAARHLLSEGRSLTGLRFGDALARAPPALRDAASAPGDSLFSTEIDGAEETFHLSQRAFILQGRSFRLYLLKRLTRLLDTAAGFFGHRGAGRAPASLRRRLCRFREAAGTAAGTRRLGCLPRRSRAPAGVCGAGGGAVVAGLVRSGASRTSADQSA